MNTYAGSRPLLSEVFRLWDENGIADDISQGTSNIFKVFTEKEAAAVSYRFGEQLTYSQIGTKLGITKQRVRQILSMAVKKLRDPVRLSEDVQNTDDDDISNLALTLRSQNALKGAGINKISELNKKTDRELLLITNIGVKVLSDIRKNLNIHEMGR
jgi:DNA-directed RNA polymerase alpha subunit